MIAPLQAAAVRARGLWTHLPSTTRIASLAEGEGAPPRVADTEACRASLARWLGRAASGFRAWMEPPVVERVRAILRGAAQGVPGRARLGETGWPSDHAERRALLAAADASTPREVVARLAAAGHPYGVALAGVPIGTGPVGLLEAEAALVVTWARRVVTGARRGGPVLRRWASEELDLVNALECLASGAAPPPADVGTVLVEGGRFLPRAAALAILHLPPDRREGAVLERMTSHWAGDTLRRASPVSVEGRIAWARLDTFERIRRLDPAGPAAIVTLFATLLLVSRAGHVVSLGRAGGAPPEVLRMAMGVP